MASIYAPLNSFSSLLFPHPTYRNPPSPQLSSNIPCSRIQPHNTILLHYAVHHNHSGGAYCQFERCLWLINKFKRLDQLSFAHWKAICRILWQLGKYNIQDRLRSSDSLLQKYYHHHSLADVPADKYSHIIYSFAGIDTTTGEV